MTIETETAPTVRRGMLSRGRGFLAALAILLFVAAVGAWICLGVGIHLDVGRDARLTLALAAALTTEALFWTIAGLLGVSVFEARKWIWRRITGGAG